MARAEAHPHPHPRLRPHLSPSARTLTHTLTLALSPHPHPHPHPRPQPAPSLSPLTQVYATTAICMFVFSGSLTLALLRLATLTGAFTAATPLTDARSVSCTAAEDGPHPNRKAPSPRRLFSSPSSPSSQPGSPSAFKGDSAIAPASLLSHAHALRYPLASLTFT